MASDQQVHGLILSNGKWLTADLAALGYRYGLAVNYEDAPLDPITELSSEYHSTNGVTYLFPKWRAITFSVPSDIPTIDEQSAYPQAGQLPLDSGRALLVLQQMVDHYNDSGNPGRFTVAAEGDHFHIEQIARRIGGQVQLFTPISQMVAKWSLKSESCQQVLDDLFATIGGQYGIKFAEGSVPGGPLLTHPCIVPEGLLTVGQVLETIVTSLRTNPSTRKVAELGYAWQLVYELNWNRYFVNLQMVRHYSPVMAETGQPNATPPKTGSNRGSGRLGAYNSVKPQN